VRRPLWDVGQVLSFNEGESHPPLFGLWHVLLLERRALGDAPWKRKNNFSWQLVGLHDGKVHELNEGHLLVYYRRLA
jgi:hypothetical protein